MSKATSTSAVAGTKKFVIAVHGIGDQVQYDTVKTVTNQFCRYFNIPSAIPLGQIHSALQDPAPGDPLHQHGIYMLPNKNNGKDHPKVGFAEVYWADIPREVVKNGYILEETKRWSRTIAERVRTCKDGKEVRLESSTYETIKRVLSEMIQTVNVLEWLTFLAEKAGFFKFRLKKLLNDYAGDVQIVTEYEVYRDKILAKFDEAMARAHLADGQAELYIVAHSEGSVVAFLGLLNAIRNKRDPAYAWLEQVRGFMTIGSPLEKHLVLWRDLMEEYAGGPDGGPGSGNKITWCNYYDHGDPVGSKLDGVWTWLKERGIEWFDLNRDRDMGFSRYIFPGKAHTDYWTDQGVFGHFIGSVMGLKRPSPNKEVKKPGTSWLAVLTTRTVPYIAMFGILFVATHLLYAALAKDIGWGEGGVAQLKNTFAVAALLAGLTVLARVPRITKTKEWGLKALSGLVAVLAVGVFYRYASEQATNDLEALSNYVLYFMHIDYDARLFGFEAARVGLCLAILLIVAATYLAGEFRPLWGLKPLIGIGGAALVGIEWLVIKSMNAESGKALYDVQVLSHLVLSTAIFLYLWWLAALLFDLVFVWHSYIRAEKVPSW
jgi:hypothetical protein